MKIFEDKFMDVQAECVACCLKYYGEKTGDLIYIYMSNEDNWISFNSFIRRNNQIIRKEEVGREDDEVSQFLLDGCFYVEEVAKVCKAYGQPIPCEMRLRYYSDTGALEAEYKYERQCDLENHIIEDVIFDNWFEEEKRALEGTGQEHK